ncbi:UDP-N-acetylmuramoyl-tripeptide--D-alanyl-D-alanine ligase [uncultured Polaribacter sp.]|uniref:UDP-N-acetylmuramoyl-tripeptide--D-alanyl-D- alanine ligase n=1 Tax=uncultured Polaribacter sp. TaxID=174711 RepID=UPI002616A2B0|nr:UDP-N-acetylmuramoyl-tripeptide--D-alanyl-D-alanine ligase [uncultured Polaribacter sp.]
MTVEELYKLYIVNYLVDTDTRTIRKNCLFFALKGDNFNGNKFATEAIAKGAKFCIIDEKEFEIKGKTILVNNVLKTLQDLAKYHRKQLNIPVIALTGSNGKTTTKELIKKVLQQKYKTAATKGNLNNHIGVPLTLLSITPKEEIAIIEMGANHQKEIAFLSNIINPDYGYITNFGKAHLEGFGGVEGVIKGKSELYTHLKQNNKTAFINPNDAIQLEKTKDSKTILLKENIKFIGANPFVELSYHKTIIKSNLIGEYNYNNIAIAITIGDFFKVENNKIKEAIESYVPKNNRSQIIQKGNNHIILDAYNANPSSMTAAIHNFAQLAEKSKTIILGDMFELGEDSAKEHQEIANLTDSRAFNATYYVGEHFSKTNTKNLKFTDFEALKVYLTKAPLNNQSILIKGSRGMQLERVLELIN